MRRNEAELDNVVRGVNGIGKGAMAKSVKKLINLCKALQLKRICLKVFSDNEHAIKFYTKIGFKLKEEIALTQISTKDKIEYVETDDRDKIDRVFWLMEIAL